MTHTNVVTMKVTIPVYTMFIVCRSDCDVTVTHTNVVTMKVTIPVYTMFIVCPSDCDVTVNQKYVSYYILNKIKCVKINKEV